MEMTTIEGNDVFSHDNDDDDHDNQVGDDHHHHFNDDVVDGDNNNDDCNEATATELKGKQALSKFSHCNFDNWRTLGF